MAGLLDFLTAPNEGYGQPTGADQIGLLGRALAGFGAGLNSGPRGLVNQGGVLTQMPSTNWGGGFAGMSEGYSQGQQDLNRRLLTGATMKNHELNRKKTQADLDRQAREQAAKDEYTAAINSGDPARISAARAQINPEAVYGEKYAPKNPISVGKGGTLVDPKTFQPVYQAPNAEESTADISEFKFAQSQGFKGTFEQWIAQKRQGAGEYGLNPIWGVDAQGNPSFVQAGKSGTAIQGKLPPGFQIARDPIKMDAGTKWILLDPQTRQVVGEQPKDVAGEKRQEAVGKGQGEAQVALPGAEMNAQTMLKSLDEMAAHPGKKGAVGDFYGRLPETTLIGEPKEFVNRLNQVKGQAFLKAFESLKGGGAITEQEGAKAAAAMERMNRATTEKEFDSAVSDLRAVINRGVEVQRQKAGSGNAPKKRLKFNPATGELE